MATGKTEGAIRPAKDPKVELIKKLKRKLSGKDRKLKELKRETRKIIDELDAAYKELRMTQEELILKEKLNVAGGIAAGIARRIRNSVDIIGMSVQHLHNKLTPGDDRREFTEAIMNKVKKLESMASDLIQFAKPRELHFRKINIHTIIDRVLDLVKFKCSVQKIFVVTEYTRNLPLIMGDKELMEQAILNLIDNALWAMPKGGKLSVATGFSEKKEFIKIQIADTGCGVAKSDRARIFEPLFTRKENGTGLGLSIVHRIVEEHKGTIKVVSQLKEGSTFTMGLPISQIKMPKKTSPDKRAQGK